VELRGWLSREELADVYEQSSGFIHVGEEDFGITMVEALAAGTPVIALDRGGARDIVRDGIDGVLLEQPDVPSLQSAVEQLARAEWDRSALAARAAEFSRERFLDRLAAAIQDARAGKEGGSA
jgi:glycosyltransferase involved in cell wall biosynthesis